MNFNLVLLMPEIALTSAAGLAILVDAFSPRGLSRRFLLWIAGGGIAISAALALRLLGTNTSAFNGAIAVDDYAVFFKLLFLAATLLVLLAADTFMEETRHRAEFVGLLLLATTGLMLLAAAMDLITLYISIEISSLSIAFLSAWDKRGLRSTEAGLKYFLLSAMSSAVLLYGMALLYGLTGHTRLDLIATQIGQGPNAALFLALAMLLAGFGFKVSAVPFQMWTPDVYEGAPLPITAFLSVASKAAGFAATVRVLQIALPTSQTDWTVLVAALAAATMTVGNIVALVQTNMKRMLAYSSIAQAGYVLVGVAAASQLGVSAVMFYLLAYTATNLAAFIACIAIFNLTDSEQIGDLRGLRWRSPWLAFALAVSLLSLAGLPPFVGFFAKLYVFWAAADRGLLWLVLVGVVNSAVSLYYYAQVIHDMYITGIGGGEPGVGDPVTTLGPRRPSPGLSTALTLAVIGVLVFGVLSGFFFGIGDVAARTVAR